MWPRVAFALHEVGPVHYRRRVAAVDARVSRGELADLLGLDILSDVEVAQEAVELVPENAV